jgi:murein DD-endopeptidase MepM/ murein hydrolase activator NlpD
MNYMKKSLLCKFISPFFIFCAFFALIVILILQQSLLEKKDQTISSLLGDNVHLRNDILSINDELLKLKETSSEVRIFQRELIKIIKNIDHNYPISFLAHSNTQTENSGLLSKFNTDYVLREARKNIFSLTSSFSNLRYEAAGLLGLTASLKDILLTTPSMIPTHGYISSGFGIRRDPFTNRLKKHFGLDIAAAIGSPVFASANGVVMLAAHNINAGNIIELSHAEGFATSYSHLRTIFVKKGQIVTRGQEIGIVGNTGLRCLGAHLHFEVKKNGVKQDPKPYLLVLPPNIF